MNEIHGYELGLSICAATSGICWLLKRRAEKLMRNEKHYWRPAMTSRGPARTCICGETQQLTTEEFYAQFGVMPNVEIVTK